MFESWIENYVFTGLAQKYISSNITCNLILVKCKTGSKRADKYASVWNWIGC